MEPKLRFPEFCGQLVQNLQLADATTESTERNGSGQTATQIMGVSKVEGIVPMEERIIAADTARYKFARKDWFAYNPMRLNIGSIARWQGEDDILVSPDYIVFRCKSSGPHRLDPAYLDHFRRSDAWEDFVSEKGDGSVRVRIYYKDLARLRLGLPSFPEQQKIADCLDSTDALIAAHGRKVEALKAHKKGLMQRLFPQEGETQPRIRFPEFEGAWVPHSLKQVTIALLDGDWIESKDQSEHGFRLIQTGNIGVGEFIAKSGKARFVSNETFERLRCTEVFPGDCLVSRLPDPLGRSCFIPDIGERMITAVDCMIVRFDEAKIFPYLFSALTQTDAYFRSVAGLSSGSTRQRISKENLSNLSFMLPPTLFEQKRIADCLSYIDDLIAAQTRKLDTFRTHKKGLMQQLFPQIGEADA